MRRYGILTGAAFICFLFLMTGFPVSRAAARPVLPPSADPYAPLDAAQEAEVAMILSGRVRPAGLMPAEAMSPAERKTSDFGKPRATHVHGGVDFLFEAAVAGGIPVLTAIQNPLQGNNFLEVMGILNGTTNYILTKMTEDGASYADVLKDAQEKGFAEADPTADVEGLDAANKLSILIALLFDKYIAPSDIPTTGISKITADDIKSAASEGCKIKLIGHAYLEDGEVKASVAPERLPLSHPLSGVSNEFNAVYVTGDMVGELMFYGRGAGALPTGSAVVGDIINVAKKLK